MEKLIDDLKKEVINKLRKDGELEGPYLRRGRDVFSRSQIINEIENDTKAGRKFVFNLIILSLDLLNRGKETTSDFKKI